jgi:hypothetical protein
MRFDYVRIVVGAGQEVVAFELLFENQKHLLNRVQVRRIRRQINEENIGRVANLHQTAAVMDSGIVQHNDTVAPWERIHHGDLGQK